VQDVSINGLFSSSGRGAGRWPFRRAPCHCIDIGTRVCSLALQLFRRHVGSVPTKPGFGQAGGEACICVQQQLRQSKIEYLTCPLGNKIFLA